MANHTQETALLRWLRAVKVITLLTILLILAPCLLPGIPYDRILPVVPLELLYWDLLASLLFYFLILRAVRVRRPKGGLALAVGTGSVVFLLAALTLAASVVRVRRYGWWPASYFASLSLLQITLVASATKTYYMLPREAHDRRNLALGIMAPLMVLGFFVLRGPPVLDGPQMQLVSNARSAIGSLLLVRMCETTYESTYHHGFSANLAELGPPSPGDPPSSRAANLIDRELAGARKHGYTFTYTPGPRDASGKIQSYRVTARPFEYRGTGVTSFFMDQFGVVHRTDEDRAAGSNDPALAFK